MLVVAGIAIGAATVGLDRPLSSSSTTASCAWREKEGYRRNWSLKTFRLCWEVGILMASRVVGVWVQAE